MYLFQLKSKTSDILIMINLLCMSKIELLVLVWLFSLHIKLYMYSLIWYTHKWLNNLDLQNILNEKTILTLIWLIPAWSWPHIELVTVMCLHNRKKRQQKCFLGCSYGRKNMIKCPLRWPNMQKKQWRKHSGAVWHIQASLHARK